MPPLQPHYRNLPNEVLRMIFSTLTDTYPRRPEALYNLLFVSRRVNAIAKPIFYRHVALNCGLHYFCAEDDCLGFQACLHSLARSIASDSGASGALVRALNLAIPERTVADGHERWLGETLELLLPHLPNLRKLTAFYVGAAEWPTTHLSLLPYPAKLMVLTVNIVHDYPAFLEFLRACPLLECLYVDAVEDKNGVLPETIPPDVIPRLRAVCCSPDFLYFCILAGRHIEHVNTLSDIPFAVYGNHPDMDALAAPMALVRSLAVDGSMSLEDILRAKVIAPYSHVEFLAVGIEDTIGVGDAQTMGELWSKELRYIYLQCEGCVPDHDTVAEAFLVAMPSLVILDVEIYRKGACRVSPRCTRYLRGNPREKNTDISFVFPTCYDFQEPLWVEEVEDLVNHRLKGIAGEPPSQDS